MTGREREGKYCKVWEGVEKLYNIINNFSQLEDLLYRKTNEREFQIRFSTLELDFLHVICQMHHALFSRERDMHENL